ncbi:MbcA/ParS/Xre antitoxin family protein [Roseateles cavernae]|uniref:MbcA/ParS/Xre antitoxin family protein n=1 Tax=Roseateles cavernae TaxID=3153578 RepID=UPI0032E3E3EE
MALSLPSREAAPTAPDLHSPAAAAAALRSFFNIAKAWGLSNEEQQRLLGCGRTSFYDWKAGRIKTGLDGATLERLSHLFGIYAALQILLPVAERADAWIKKPNSAALFGGRSALERMLGGQVADLFVVRQYLDAQRGGWS